MGNSLSSIIDGLVDNTDEEKVVKDTLYALYEVGLSRTQSVVAEATSVQNTVYVPFSKVLFQKQQILCNTSTDADGIVDGIKDAVSNLIQGQILDGVTDIIRHGLKVVLGSSIGQISSEHTYAIIATELGALLRIDTDVYNFETTSEKLMTTAKNVTAITAVISSVDGSKLTASDIRALVSLTYSASPIQKQSDILKLVMAAWEEDRKGNFDSTSLGLSGEALERFRSHFVPSEYERNSPVPRNLQNQSDVLAIRKKPALTYRRGVKSLLQESVLKHTNEKQDYNRRQPRVSAERDMISIVITLCKPVDSYWIEHMGERFREYSEPGFFEYVGFADATNGNVISYQYKVVDPDTFETCRLWSNDIISEIRTTIGDYVRPVSSLHLQYKNGPTVGATSIEYYNVVTNKTRDTVVFCSPDPDPHRWELTILPDQTAFLSFKTLYIRNSEDQTRWLTYIDLNDRGTVLPEPHQEVTLHAITMVGEEFAGLDLGYEMTFSRDGKPHSIQYATKFISSSVMDQPNRPI
ncbi:hypothetical protein F4821DRAFT_239452 [Hypoxylon rubiginosum]|uniref:Uncharacterized protein n=1 Tax=Hypoxylon rubiginosum TaxID=110542 RepID=A0ACC0D047_9PEZI|nr:hypothetical protein F4821DRAFT_239452 [Hypoxylon rubiginosum]